MNSIIIRLFEFHRCSYFHFSGILTFYVSLSVAIKRDWVKFEMVMFTFSVNIFVGEGILNYVSTHLTEVKDICRDSNSSSTVEGEWSV